MDFAQKVGLNFISLYLIKFNDEKNVKKSKKDMVKKRSKRFFLDLSHSSIYLDYHKLVWKVLWLSLRKRGENMMLNEAEAG